MRKIIEIKRIRTKQNRKVATLPSFIKHRPKERLYNCVWTFHKYDVDFLPSVPHGHSGKYKLDVNNGAVYSNSYENAVGYATKKELYRLQRNKEFQQFAKEHINWYKTTFPSIPIDEPEWLRDKKTIKEHWQRNNAAGETICFTIKVVLKTK